MKKIFTALMIAYSTFVAAQCNTQTVTGDLVITSDIILSGTYQVSGKFHIISGVTVFVEPYGYSNCGMLEIHASEIIIEGTINGDYAGYPGGTAGSGATSVTSLTGDEIALDDCSNKDNTGMVTVHGGIGGGNGNGPGAGLGGNAGANGSGPKQVCQSNGDEAGMIAGAGGAGGGGGGAYGGSGTNGNNGGDGGDYYTTSDVSISSAYVVQKGTGGTGGNTGSTTGTNNGNDIDLGSGGGGSGGGGRSMITGNDGNRGGNGGGLVKLVASDSVVISGTVSVNGENGLNGGKGGDGGQSPDCCSDGCNDCGERTLSCGAGGGSGSGAGSGGGIWIEGTNKVQISGHLKANGGNGGNGGSEGNGETCSYSGGIFCGNETIISGAGNVGGHGGAGGGGRIKVVVPDCNMAVISAAIETLAGTSPAGAQDGTYALICSAVSTMDIEAKNNFSVFPNPANEQVNIRWLGSQNNYYDISVTDATGRIVYGNNYYLVTDNIIQLDISYLTNGLYFITITGNQQLFVQKFIKQ